MAIIAPEETTLFRRNDTLAESREESWMLEGQTHGFPTILSPSKVYNSATLRWEPRKKERGGGIEPDLWLSLPRPFRGLLPRLRKPSLTLPTLPTNLPTRSGVGCITIGSSARCTRARKSLLFHLHLAPCKPFDAVTCRRLNLEPI